MENHPGKTGAVIIDGLSSCINNLQILHDDILENNIPVVVILDQSEIDMVEHLEVRGFRIWQWNKENKNLSNTTSIVEKHSVFYQIDKAMSNFTKLEVTVKECEFPLVKQVMEHIWQIEKIIDKNNEQINSLLNKIIFIVLELSRLIRVPTETKMAELEDKLRILNQQLKHARLWIPIEQEKLFSTALELLLSINVNKFNKKRHKIALLKDWFNTSDEWDSIALVVHKKNEVEDCRDFWGGIVNQKNRANISFYTFKEIIESDLSYSPTEIIVCGWLGYEKMTKIINSCYSSKITLLLYSYEMEWYRFAKRKWSKYKNYNVRYSDFPQVSIKETRDKLVEPEVTTTVPKAVNEFEDFELRMNQLTYSQYIVPSGDKTEAVQARMIRYAGSWFSFCTASHGLHVVTDLIRAC